MNKVLNLAKNILFKISIFFKNFLYKKQSVRVVVVGLPRCGTSFLTGFISKIGLSVGPESWLLGANKHNKYGYFECRPLNSISTNILKKLGGTFFKLPPIPSNWKNQFTKEKKQIQQIVTAGKIELYKDNKLSVMPDYFANIFPKAKWIYITRNIQDTYKSRFGTKLTMKEWEKLTAKREQIWLSSNVSKSALVLHYEDFKENTSKELDKIADFLGITLTKQQKKDCLDFYKPNSKKNA